MNQNCIFFCIFANVATQNSRRVWRIKTGLCFNPRKTKKRIKRIEREYIYIYVFIEALTNVVGFRVLPIQIGKQRK